MRLKHPVRTFLLPAFAAAMLTAGCASDGAGDEDSREEEKIVTVAVTEIKTGRMEDWLELPGKIEPFREVRISAEVGGLLEWLGAEEGDAVSEGQKLAVIDRENLELHERQAALALEQSRIGVEVARLGVETAVIAQESAAAAGVQAGAALAQAFEVEKKARVLWEERGRDSERGKALFAEQLTSRSTIDDLGMALEAAAADLASAGEGVKAARGGESVALAGKKGAEAGLKSAGEGLAAARSMVKTAEANLEQARLFLRKSTISSPLDGYLDRTSFEAGELVGANDELLMIVQVRPVKAVFHLPEKDVPFLRTGMNAAVTIASLSPRPFDGRVSLIGITSDPGTSTYRLEVNVENSEGLIRPGMLARLRLLRQGLDESVSVPIFAVRSGEKESFLYVYDDGVARRRTVSTGILDGDRVQITEGVGPGDFVIVKGHRDLEDGQSVNLP